MITISLTEQDVLRLHVIDMDRDEKEALAFLRERILSEVKRIEGSQIHCHVNGRK